ncbi:MAG: zinc-binding dehydrogenase [Chloroflexi bacterium]|nr:zinc-binding dehydrogenase [Chloroflexota bacterium]
MAILRQINQPLVIEELPIPELQPGQVLVKIRYSGVCHSQLNEIKGLKGEDKYLPHTLGHEAGGIVQEIGPGVSHVKPGDHAVLSWIEGPGMGVPSTTYHKGKEIVNAGAITTFGEYSVISENRVTPITEEMPLDKAALLGCALPTGGGIVLNQLKPAPGSSLAVIGVGGLGLSSILLADLMNCAPIIAIDINDDKLQLARRLGATETINSATTDFVSAILDITHGKGVDYAIETAGLTETIEKSFASVKWDIWDGGLLVIAGNPPHDARIAIDPFLLKGKRLTGSWGGQSRPERDIPLYVDLYLAGKLKLDELITDRFKFAEINRAFQAMDKGKLVGKAILEF